MTEDYLKFNYFLHLRFKNYEITSIKILLIENFSTIPKAHTNYSNFGFGFKNCSMFNNSCNIGLKSKH